MQFLFPGYVSGNDGLVIVPLLSSKTPPQASIRIKLYYFIIQYYVEMVMLNATLKNYF